MSQPISLDDHRGGMCNPECLCAKPSHWPVCEEWMGIDGETGKFCPRCGWTRRCHPDTPEPETAFNAEETPGQPPRQHEGRMRCG